MNSKRLTLICLIVLFLTPGMLAYLFFKHPDWMTGNPTNKGSLLTPALAIDSLGEKPLWRIVLWNIGACEANCLQQIDKLARIRLALGRHLYEVEEWVILNQKTPLSPALQASFKTNDIHYQYLAPSRFNTIKPFAQKTPVFLASPENLLILAYPSQTNASDIFHDINVLLKTKKG